jgi:signal transduction histidine kinase
MRTPTLRHFNVDATRSIPDRSRRLRPFKAKLSEADTAAAAVELVNELVSQTSNSRDVSRRALERLQLHAHATAAAVWTITDTAATCLSCVSHGCEDPTPRAVALADQAMAERLRRHRAVICQATDVSGLEDLVPDGVRSFVAATGPNHDGALGVLVIGWDAARAPCDDTAITHLRVAAALLQRALTDPAGEQRNLTSDISAKRRAESALTETASKLVAAQEAERSRISRELHDDLGQRAALLAAKLESLARHPHLPVDLRQGVVDAQDSLQELAVAIHSLSHQLHPARLKLLGLVKTLGGLCRDVSKENSVKVHFQPDGIPSDVPERIALCVFRVAQEALQNAVKHSAAREIDVRLTATASRLMLRVKDKGRGFDPLTSQATGIGLLTMQERVELSGGQLTIKAAEARGTTIEAMLPLTENSTGGA